MVPAGDVLYAGEITVIKLGFYFTENGKISNKRHWSAENPMSIHGVLSHDINFDERCVATATRVT